MVPWRLSLACMLAAGGCSAYHATDTAPIDGGTTPPPVAPPPPGEDAGTDAAADAADGGGFCAHQGVVTFCSDFDESTDPVADWNGPNVGDGGALAIDDVVFESSPHALRASTTTGDTASVTRTFTVPKKVTIDVAFFVKALPPSTGFNILLVGPNGPHPVYFFTETGKCYFQDGPDEFSTFLSPPSTNAWHHIEIVVTDGSTITATFDGVAAWTGHTLKYPWPSPTIASLEVGVAGLIPPGASNVWIDDVLVRTE